MWKGHRLQCSHFYYQYRALQQPLVLLERPSEADTQRGGVAKLVRAKVFVSNRYRHHGAERIAVRDGVTLGDDDNVAVDSNIQRQHACSRTNLHLAQYRINQISSNSQRQRLPHIHRYQATTEPAVYFTGSALLCFISISFKNGHRITKRIANQCMYFDPSILVPQPL